VLKIVNNNVTRFVTRICDNLVVNASWLPELIIERVFVYPTGGCRNLLSMFPLENIGNQIEAFLFMLVLIITIYPTVKTDHSKTNPRLKGRSEIHAGFPCPVHVCVMTSITA
jgi:hypothetical protein